MRTSRPAVIANALALVGSAGAFAASAFGTASSSPPAGAGQQAQLVRACGATVASIKSALKELPKTRVQTIQSHLEVVTPGTLNGKIAFNLTGSSISLAGDPPAEARAAAASFGCGQAASGGGKGHGPSHVVSTLHRKFSLPGGYELTFKLNQTGQTMLSKLAAAERAYRLRHPRGHRPPTLAFGVSLTYAAPG
jgi:hypothetical protein